MQDREEAVAVLSSEDCRNIMLLVARPELQVGNSPFAHRSNSFMETCVQK